jgi:hypothetical protein
VAEAEVALAARDLGGRVHGIAAAVRTLDDLGDRANALHARLVMARRHLLVGELDAAAKALAAVDEAEGSPPASLMARAELTRAEIAMRRTLASQALAALDRAESAAIASGIAALVAEIRRARHSLSQPSARLASGGVARPVTLDEVERLFASENLIVDACRRAVRGRSRCVDFAGRPILFALAAALARAWPEDVARDALIEKTFRARAIDQSHRARLRVELSRLRAALKPIARIEATARGFALVPVGADAAVVLEPPIDGEAGAILALLEGGESWSTSALSHALGSSQRTVQRALRELQETAAVRAAGSGRSRRWLAPAPGGFATNLLLPGALPFA